MRYIILGTGNISNTYVAALKNIPECDLVGCVSRSGNRPSQATDLKCWPSILSVDVPFDAVIITTPNGLHHKGAIEAARLKKHILTEKPLDITIESMALMIEEVQRTKVTLAVSYQYRTSPDNITIRQMIENNSFGKIYAADLSCRFWRDQAYYDSGSYRGKYAIDGGGPFMQQACHNIDLYIWFFGIPKTVSSQLGTFAHSIEVEDHGAALLRHDNGMIGTIIASTATKPGFPARLEVTCEKGSFTMIDHRITVWNIDGIHNPAAQQDSYSHNSATSAQVTDTTRHEDIIRDFESAVKNNRPPIADFESARKTTELILSIYGRR